jgi:hypothetical protein
MRNKWTITFKILVSDLKGDTPLVSDLTGDTPLVADLKGDAPLVYDEKQVEYHL